MDATISDLLHSPAMTLTPHQSVGHVRDLMQQHGGSAFPLVEPGPTRSQCPTSSPPGAGGTDEVTGMVSSFDLLRLVEDHRFVMKHAPTPSKRANARS